MRYIRVLSFLLQQVQGNHLGIKICDDLIREKQSADAALAGGSTPKRGKENGHQNELRNTMDQPLGN